MSGRVGLISAKRGVCRLSYGRDISSARTNLA
jgi:hypothetical protein